MDMEYTKEQLIDWLTRKAKLDLEYLALAKEFNCFCMNVYESEIHVSSSDFYKMADTLQVPVALNLEWSKKYPDDVEASFYVNLCGVPWKIFALLQREEVRT